MKTTYSLLVLLMLISCSGCKEKKNDPITPESRILAFRDIQKGSPINNISEAVCTDGVSSVGLKSDRFISDSKLVKTGSIAVVSENVEATKIQINSILKKCNGYSTYESLNAKGSNVSCNIQFEVPANNFDRFMNLVDSLGLNITSKSIRVFDATMQHIDETTRLENKRKLEKSYLALLAKAKTVDEILKINSTIEEIRSDIESRESQLNALEKQFAVSSIDVQIDKKVTVKEQKDSSSDFDSINRYREALLDGVEGINVFVVFMLSIWPLYIVAVVLFIVIRLIFKRYKKKRVAQGL